MNASSSINIPVARHIDASSVRKLSLARLRTSQRTFRAELALSISMNMVKKSGYTVFHGDVYDLKRFAKHHPGGAFLQSLASTDATLALENAHGKAAKIRKMFKRFYIGPFAEETRDPLERDALRLRDDLIKEGLFTYGPRRIAFDIARWVVFFAAGIVALPWSHAAAFALILAGTIDVVWWIHDAGHDAVFDDEAKARNVIDRLGAVILGMPQQGYHYAVHRMHHSFTNVVGIDGALDTGPLTWTEETAARKPSMYRRGRIFQWFFGIIPFAGPALLYSAVAYSVEKKQRGMLVFLALRWAIVIAFALYVQAPSLIIAPWVAGSILAFMAGLNHFHLAITTAADPRYARSAFERTQNIGNAGLFWHWLSGGLDLHVEHHLFPTMASYRYRAIAPRVRLLAMRHRVPYRVTSRSGAVMNLVRVLLAPLPGGRAPSSPEISVPESLPQ